MVAELNTWPHNLISTDYKIEHEQVVLPVHTHHGGPGLGGGVVGVGGAGDGQPVSRTLQYGEN